MASTAQLQTWLTEAEAALHSLVIGRQASVFVDQNGERIEYTRTSVSGLRSYIADLKRQLGLTPTGPMQAWF